MRPLFARRCQLSIAPTNRIRLLVLHDTQRVFFLDLTDNFFGSNGTMLPGLMSDRASIPALAATLRGSVN